MASSRVEKVEAEVNRQLKEMKEQIQQMFTAVHHKIEDVHQQSISGESSNAQTGQGKCRPKIKFDLPTYKGGSDPRNWIYKLNNYFEYFNIPEEEKVFLASWHLEGDALVWFQLLERKHEGRLTWSLISERLSSRFGYKFKDSFAVLLRLQQRGTVEEYLLQFSRLLLGAGKLAPGFEVCLFIRGLNDSLRSDVEMRLPAKLSEAVRLARLFEGRDWEGAEDP